MGIRRLTLTRAIRVARGNDVACREAGDTKSTLISASWPSYTLSSMMAQSIQKFNFSLISLFPIENRKASMDCLEGQNKMAENFKS